MRARGTARVRRAAGWAGRGFRRGALILLYHRVADVGRDTWSLAVSPDHFAEHLDVLVHTCYPTSLQRLACHSQADRFPGRAVAITFDDGYADNLYEARPLLERYDVPATVFVTASSRHGETEYWWDELERLVHAPDAPSHLQPCLESTALAGRTSGQDAPEDLYNDIWGILQPLAWGNRRALLHQLRGCIHDLAPADHTRRPLTDDELGRLGADGLVEIGGHSVSHPLLTALPADALQEEINGGKRHLDNVLGSPISSFSYPFGEGGPPAGPVEQAVQSAGFTLACTNRRGTLRTPADPYHLPRYVVDDWSGDHFARRLRKWLLD